ncbi:outer membrane beta-barrel family protein [Flavobacteriaceae bacterium 3-367]
MHRGIMAIAILLSYIAYGQTHTLSGSVVDGDGAPVAFGDALLFAIKDGTLINYTTITDGIFFFEGIGQGGYRLRISCLGFSDESRVLEVHENKELQIQMTENVTELDAVELRGSKNVFSNEHGNLKVNVDNPIFSSIPDALDLLSRLPNLQLSPDRESLTVIGKGTPLIYLRNQQISLEEFAALPVEGISSIEIINNPSAKYEAAGRAVLLITLKPNLSEGIKLNVSETASSKRNFNHFLNTNGTYRKKGLSLRGNLALNHLQTWESNGFEFQIPAQDIQTDYLALMRANTRLQTHMGAGLSYQFNDTDYFSLGTLLKLQTDKFPIDTDTFLAQGTSADFIVSQTLNDNTKDFFSGNLNFNKQLGENLNVFLGGQYSSFVQKLDTDISNDFNSTGFVPSQSRQQKYQLDALAFRLDLESAFTHGARWELGFNVNEARAKARTQVQAIGDADLDTDYRYEEGIFGVYAQFSGKMRKKVGYSAGLRMETNLVQGKFTDAPNFLVDRKNTNFFPKMRLSVPIDSTKSITLNYSRSIERPNFSNASSITTFINPFLEFSRNINLKPTLIDEVSMNFQYKKSSLGFSYYQQKNPIYYSVFYDEEADRAIFGPVNLGEQSGWNLNVNVPISYRKWTASFSMVLTNNNITDPEAAMAKAKPFLYYYSSHQFRITKDTIISMDGWGLTKREEGIFKRNALFVMNAGISQTFFKKLQCSLRFNDIGRAMRFEESYVINGIRSEGIFFTDAQEIALTVKYALGKIKDPDLKNRDIDQNLDRIK